MTVADKPPKNENAGEIRANPNDLIDARQAGELLDVDAATVHRWAGAKGGPKPEVDRPNLKLWRWGPLRNWARANKKGRFKASREIRERTITAEHGTMAAYRQGCRCDLCRAENTRWHREYQERRRNA